MRAMTKTTTRGTTAARASLPVNAGRRARTRWDARCEGTARARTRETRVGVVSREGGRLGARGREMRAMGGAGTRAPREARGLVVVAGSEGEGAAVTVKKPRLPALDSIRFFLIAYIGVGYFIACATREAATLAALSQVNVVVGAFFVLSGYVAAYTTTELGRYEAQMKRLRPSPKYFISRVMGFYPLYFVVNALFAPMFFYADSFYNGPVAAAVHGLMTFTLTQSWFPMHAELWNAPSWFLSSFVFCLAALPFALPSIATFKRKHVDAAFKVLVIVSLLAKLAYSYDLNAWGFMEGVMSAKTHPNWLYFNSVRFSPFNALVDVLMGAVAARSVMIDSAEDESTPKTNAILACSATPLVAMIGFSRGASARIDRHQRRFVENYLHRSLFGVRRQRTPRDGARGRRRIDGFQSAVVETVGVPRNDLVSDLHPPRTDRTGVLQARRRDETLRHSLHEVPSVFPGLSSHRARLRRGRARDLHQE